MESVVSLINSVAGLVAAVGGLLGGVAAVLAALQKRGEKKRKLAKSSGVTGRTALVVGVVLILISVAIFAVRAWVPASAPKKVVPATADQKPGASVTTPEPPPRTTSASLTTSAWDALNAKDYSGAIAKAQECVDEFRASADRQQAELEKRKAPTPPDGKVTKTERETLLSRGPLNDVGTCYFIIGRAAEYLGRKDMAREAYGLAVRYTYARTWDPGGWFWSPAQAANDRLTGLK